MLMTEQQILTKSLQETVDYLYDIKEDVTKQQYEAISRLRQLINEGFVKENKQVSNQFIYDQLEEIL